MSQRKDLPPTMIDTGKDKDSDDSINAASTSSSASQADDDVLNFNQTAYEDLLNLNQAAYEDDEDEILADLLRDLHFGENGINDATNTTSRLLQLLPRKSNKAIIYLGQDEDDLTIPANNTTTTTTTTTTPTTIPPNSREISPIRKEMIDLKRKREEDDTEEPIFKRARR